MGLFGLRLSLGLSSKFIFCRKILFLLLLCETVDPRERDLNPSISGDVSRTTPFFCFFVAKVPDALSLQSSFCAKVSGSASCGKKGEEGSGAYKCQFPSMPSPLFGIE